MGTTIQEKPWGSELTWAHRARYAGRLLHIKGGHRLSRHYHSLKEETLFVLEGKLRLEIGPDQYNPEIEIRQLHEGMSISLPPGTIHRLCAEEGDVRVIEASSPEDYDFVRLEDDYKRIDKDDLPPKKPPRFEK